MGKATPRIGTAQEDEVAAIAQRRPQARIAIRLISEFAAACAVDLIRCFDGEFERGVIFCALLKGTGSFLPSGAAPDVPATISINALAAALHRPFETVRQHILKLEEIGWCGRTRAGLVVAGSGVRGAEIQLLLDRLHDRLVRLTEDLGQGGIPLPEARETVDGDCCKVVRECAIELLLAVCELSGEVHGGWIRMLIYGTLMIANARPITFDTALSATYSEADTPPPDSLRQPIPLKTLTQVLHLPYPTLSRHVRIQTEAGTIVRGRGGIMISLQSLQNPAIQAGSGQLSGRLLALLRRMQAAGFPFDQPEMAYVGGRPDYLDFKGG